MCVQIADRSVDRGGALNSGATLVRQWRGHTHTVLVREDGFEYDGQRYRSLTVIAERIFWLATRFRHKSMAAGLECSPMGATEGCPSRRD